MVPSNLSVLCPTGVTVVPRNAISGEVEKKQKEGGLVRTQTSAELAQAKADVEKLKAEKEKAEAAAKAAVLKAEEEKVARDIAEAQAKAGTVHKCPDGHKLTHDPISGSSVRTMTMTITTAHSFFLSFLLSFSIQLKIFLSEETFV